MMISDHAFTNTANGVVCLYQHVTQIALGVRVYEPCLKTREEHTQ